MTAHAFCRNFPTTESAQRAFRCFFSKGCPPQEMPQKENAFWMECQTQAYAEALLWNYFHYGRKTKLSARMASFMPFGSAEDGYPPFASLYGQRGLIALFPICSDTVSHVCFMYLFKKQGLENFKDHRGLLVGNSIISNDVRIYITKDFSPLADCIDGNSWQLAYHLALHFLNEEIYDSKLLTGFLLTGAVEDNNAVTAVEKIGKKIELLRRPWQFSLVLPENNKADIPENLDNLKYHTVGEVEQAWRLISKVGFADSDIILPNPISEFHILVGGSANPAIYTILLLNPEKVFLWHSEESFETAQKIKAYLQRYPSLNIEFELKKMDSGKLQNCYSDLDRYFQSSLCSEYCVINITGGNRLMGFAALLIAQTYNVKVIYRDRNAAEEELTAISFDNGKRNSGTVKVNCCPAYVKPQINWQELLK